MENNKLGMPRVAIFVEAALHGTNVQRYGVQHFARLANVAIVDFRRIYNPTFEPQDEVKPSGVDYFLPSSLSDLFETLDRVLPEVVIDFAQLPRVQVKTRAWLRGRGVIVVSKVDGRLPSPSLFSRCCHFLILRLIGISGVLANSPGSTHTPRGVFSDIFDSIRITLMPPEVGLFAGSEARWGRSFFAKKAYRIPSLDVITHSTVKSGAVFEDKKILFVDENLAESPDWSLLGLTAPVSPVKYYESLRNLFTFLESLGYEVVIAAHPDRKEHPNLYEKFGHRKICIGHTAELTASVSAVLLHQSTAISFAVLNEVPIGFLTNRSINSSAVAKRMRVMSKVLNRAIINLDDFGLREIDKLFKPADKSRYKNYSRRFLVSPKCSASGQWAPVDELLQKKVNRDA